MMMVRCYLGQNATEGLGVFTHQAIRKGALIRCYDSRFDLNYFRDDLDRVPTHFRDFLDRYTYAHPTDPDRVVLECDEARFMNQSDTPNVDLSPSARGVALRDIPAHQELTCDYARLSGSTVSTRPVHIRATPALHPAE